MYIIIHVYSSIYNWTYGLFSFLSISLYFHIFFYCSLTCWFSVGWDDIGKRQLCMRPKTEEDLTFYLVQVDRFVKERREFQDEWTVRSMQAGTDRGGRRRATRNQFTDRKKIIYRLTLRYKRYLAHFFFFSFFYIIKKIYIFYI